MRAPARGESRKGNNCVGFVLNPSAPGKLRIGGVVGHGREYRSGAEVGAGVGKRTIIGDIEPSPMIGFISRLHAYSSVNTKVHFG